MIGSSGHRVIRSLKARNCLSGRCLCVLGLALLFAVPPCRSLSSRWRPKDSAFLFAAPQEQAATPDAVVHSIVDAIQKNYLRTRTNPLWNIARDNLLAGKYKTAADVFQVARQQLPYMEDSELNLLTPAEVEAVQSVALGQKVGLGIDDFCIDMQPDTGRARVVTPIFGSPAMKAGIQSGDVIVSINGKATSDMNHEQVMDLLHAPGPDGAKLQIERGEDTLNVVVQPSLEKVEVLQSAVKRVSGKSIGYIRIALFSPDVAQKAREAITKLEQEGVDGYVLDLRNNPGGFLSQAKDIAGMFVAGTLGYEVRSDDKKQPIEVKGAPLIKKSLAVLINAGTASASEFLAGALQGLHRGVLVGVTTYGRGQAQIFVSLADGYGIQIPAVQLLTPDDKEFKGKGIAPDIEVSEELMPETQIAGPKDKQFMKAVAELTADRH